MQCAHAPCCGCIMTLSMTIVGCQQKCKLTFGLLSFITKELFLHLKGRCHQYSKTSGSFSFFLTVRWPKILRKIHLSVIAASMSIEWFCINQYINVSSHYCAARRTVVVLTTLVAWGAHALHLRPPLSSMSCSKHQQQHNGDPSATSAKLRFGETSAVSNLVEDRAIFWASSRYNRLSEMVLRNEE